MHGGGPAGGPLWPSLLLGPSSWPRDNRVLKPCVYHQRAAWPERRPLSDGWGANFSLVKHKEAAHKFVFFKRGRNLKRSSREISFFGLVLHGGLTILVGP